MRNTFVILWAPGPAWVEGKAVRVRPYRAEHAAFMRYLGSRDVFPWHRPDDERVVFVIQPEHTTSQNTEKVSQLEKKGCVAEAKKASDRLE